MGSSPSPPDPYATAAAQGAAERSAAVASSIVNNMNETTPFGAVEHRTVGYETITGEDGNPVKVPVRQRVTTLNRREQNKYDKRHEVELNLLNAGVDQSEKLRQSLSDPIKTGNLQKRGTVVDAPSLAQYSDPTYIKTSYDDGGDVRKTYDDGGKISNFSNNAGLIGAFESDAGRLGNFNSQSTNSTRIEDDRDAFSGDRKRVEEALFSRLNPELQRDRAALESQLASQGLQRGTEAFNQAMDEHNRQSTDARMQAILAGGQEQSRLLGEQRANIDLNNNAGLLDFETALAKYQANADAQAQRYGQDQATYATNLAGQDQRFAQARSTYDANLAAQQQRNTQNREEGEFANAAQQQRNTQNLQAATFRNAARQQNNDNAYRDTTATNQRRTQQYQLRTDSEAQKTARRQDQLQEQIALRTQPLNEMISALSGTPLNVPQFASPYRQPINAAPVGDYIMRNYEIEANQAAQRNAGLFGLGSAVIGTAGSLLSDIRFKEDIRRVGRTDAGLPIYTFRYKGDPAVRMGVMAQEVAQTQPEAVSSVGGVLFVDHAQVR